MAGRWALSLGAKVQGETGTVESKLIVNATNDTAHRRDGDRRGRRGRGGSRLWAGQTGLIKLPIDATDGNDRVAQPKPPGRSSITTIPTGGRSIR